MLHPEREARGHDGALRDTFLTRERKKDSRKGPDGYECQCVCVCVGGHGHDEPGKSGPQTTSFVPQYPRDTFREGIWPEGQTKRISSSSRGWRTMGGRAGDNIYK